MMCAMSEAAGLRERQAMVAREAMIDALLDALEAGEDDVAIGELARRAGVSRRTLYRYFPSRDSLVAAAAERLYDPAGGRRVEVGGPDGIVRSFLAASAVSTQRPQLARALIESRGGRELRGSVMRARSEAIARALEPITDALDPAERRRATAMVQELCSLRSWVTLHFDRGLDVEDAQGAAAWALETLIADVRRRNDEARARART